MEPEVSLPCSQETATGLYPEPDASIPHPHTILRIHFNTILSSVLGFPLHLPNEMYEFLISAFLNCGKML